jgi:hypothetical protein
MADRLNATRQHDAEYTPPWVPERLFTRLPLPVKPGDAVTLSDGRTATVETVKVADDLRDAKCIVVIADVMTGEPR